MGVEREEADADGSRPDRHPDRRLKPVAFAACRDSGFAVTVLQVEFKAEASRVEHQEKIVSDQIQDRAKDAALDPGELDNVEQVPRCVGKGPDLRS